MVEFALVLIPLLLMVLGTIDWGYYFFIREVVTNAAREGARTGAVAQSQAIGVTAANTYLSGVGLQQLAIPCPNPPPGTNACVSITYPTGSLTGFLPAPTLIPLNAQATVTMRLE